LVEVAVVGLGGRGVAMVGLLAKGFAEGGIGQEQIYRCPKMGIMLI
jgi:hypothetical protein